MTLTGSASVADYQAALTTVVYNNTSDNPSVLTRTVSFEINDGDLNSNIVNRDIDFTAVNDAPVLSGIETAPASYTENDAPLAITGSTAVSDVDDTNIESAVVSISSNFSVDDVLNFTDQSGITGSYDSVNGVLTLTGSASLIDYQAALQSISYVNTSDDPSDLTRTVTIQINDGDVDSNVVSRDINFTAVNDAPVTVPVTLTAIAEDSGPRLITQAELLSNTTDVEGDALTATGLVISAGNGILTDNGDGTWSYTPAANDDTDVSFTYTVSDSTDNIAANVTLDITPVNDPPTTAPVTLTGIAEDSGVHLITQADLLANANDIEGEGLTAVGLIITSGGGTLIDNGDGTWSYTPAANDDTDVSFAYTVTDSMDIIAGSAVLDIIPVNDSPEGVDSTVQTPEDTPYVLTISDFPFSDGLEGDEFSGILITSLPVDGVLSLSGVPVMVMDFIDASEIEGGALVFTPPLNFVSNGSDNALGYLLRDSGGTLNGGVDVDPEIRHLTFDVTAVNDGPEIITDVVTLDEGADILIDSDHLSGFDVDDLLPQDLTYTLQSQPENGALILSGTVLSAGDTFTLAELNDNQLRYVHDGSETSSDFVDLSLADGGEDGALAASGRLSFVILEVIDQAPAIENDQLILQLGETFNSEDGDTLASGFATLGGNLLQENSGFVISIEIAPQQGTVEINQNGSFTYVHNDSTVLQDEFTYRITNEDGAFTLATVSISIEPPIDAILVGSVLPVDFPQVTPEFETETEIGTETGIDVETNTTPEQEQEQEQAEAEEEVDSVAEELGADFFGAPIAEALLTDRQVNLASSDSVIAQNVVSQSNRSSQLSTIEVIQHNEVTGVLLFSTDSLVNDSVLQISLDSELNRISYANYLRSLEQLDRDFTDAQSEEAVKTVLANEAIYGVTFSATAGILTWVLRGGTLLASAMASTPMWSSIDPVKVFSGAKKEEESDEVENLFDKDQ